ncbi:hypothetical protein CI109_106048 [Kwoniella shandongensis]|uniref:Uncharacterized protein n=1 Tax=Kwoniella shandongensis TaxID=1734106 RepID=A0A5M6BZI1_9TREE|nr:uncharacterized protein CI109_003899 [Kwoniella shandongensis]KAA5527640.1 hypothetical protein CI109_003899 [Kwoniella shandongensis]
MQNVDIRLASFNAITKPKTKARPAFPLTSSTHPHLTPRTLSEAGFYYTPEPSTSTLDTCTCFLCGLILATWDETDDPFEEHAARIDNDCAWGEIFCAAKVERKKRVEGKGAYETIYETADSLPQSKHSIARRLATFGTWWPHKQKRGWLPTPKALARAGFVYNPSTESTDAVICPHCEYSVEGWEATDDPWEIHHNKREDCLFFRASLHPDAVEAGTSEVKTKSTGRRKKSEAPKTTRAKRATTATRVALSDSEAEPEIRPTQSEADEEITPPSQTTTTGKRATKPRATTTKAKTGGRGKKKAATVEPEAEEDANVIDVNDEVEEIQPILEEDVVESTVEEVKEKKTKAKSKPTKSKPRATTTTKSKSKKKVEQEEEEEGEDVEVDEVVEVETANAPEVNSEPENSTRPASTASQSKSSKSTKTTVKGSSKSSSSKPLPPLPTASLPTSPAQQRPLSQLDRFANIPASSPIPSPRSKSTLRSTQSSKPTGKPIPREEYDKVVQRGAIEARQVIEDLMSSPFVGSPLTKRTEAAQEEDNGVNGALVLTEEQKKMTLEELVRAEMKRRYEELERDGEEMIKRWEERAKHDRKKIEAI